MEKFSADESLQIIRTMIDKAKTDMSDKSGHFLVWGWLTFTACVSQFILLHWVEYEKHYLVWFLVIVGAGYSTWRWMSEGRRKKVNTYVGDSMKYLWLGMGISFFILSLVLTKIGWGSNVFPFFIILYALGTFVSGCFIRFRPLVVGGSVSWLLAVLAVYLDYDYQILVAALAILLSYIIPAHLMRLRNSKLKMPHNV